MLLQVFNSMRNETKREGMDTANERALGLLVGQVDVSALEHTRIYGRRVVGCLGDAELPFRAGLGTTLFTPGILTNSFERLSIFSFSSS